LIGKHDPNGPEKTKGIEWNNHTVKFGWRVEGIFPAGAGTEYVNAVCLSPDHEIVATGCDYGNVRLYNNPCREGSEALILRGHSEAVTNLNFQGSNSNRLITTGGSDNTVI